jgi:DNA-binding LacI/PurR family transcriptional regulator
MLYLSGDASVRSGCVSRVRDLGYTFVLFQESNDHGDAPSISVDNRSGARKLTEYLFSRGHTRIAFIAARTTWHMIEERHSGYLEALRDQGVDPSRELQLFRGRWDATSGEEMAKAPLTLAEPPTAIIGGNDLLAIGAMRAIRAAGLTIPDDIAVAAFNDFDFSAFVEPPLMTVAIPAYDMGVTSATILIDQIEGRETVSQHTSPLSSSFATRHEMGAKKNGRLITHSQPALVRTTDRCWPACLGHRSRRRASRKRCSMSEP